MGEERLGAANVLYRSGQWAVLNFEFSALLNAEAVAFAVQLREGMKDVSVSLLSTNVT